MGPKVVINFYKFIQLTDAEVAAIRDDHLGLLGARGCLGSLLLAPEGINISVWGNRDDVDAYVAYVKSDPRFSDVVVRYSAGKLVPFKGLYCKVKRWIIRFADDAEFAIEDIKAGERILPTELAKKLEAGLGDDTVLIDTRNTYEYEFGKFAGAKGLPINHFTEFCSAFEEAYADQRDKNFIFYCTGGVRCEKIIPWAKSRGYKNVTQLEGGILRYFEDVGPQYYEGRCFVFDRRWILDATLNEVDDDDEAIRQQPKPVGVRLPVSVPQPQTAG
jgi:UPF0176 protein